MKKYYFTDDSWWDSPGCSCCPATLMEAYNSEDTHPSLGTAHYMLECYIQAIRSILLKRNDSHHFDSEALYLLGEDEIKALCTAMGIEVEIDNEDKQESTLKDIKGES